MNGARTAFLFPGQGEEGAGMGAAYLRQPGPVQKLLARAGSQLGLDLAAVVARGAPALGRTEIVQPALVALTLGLAQELLALGEAPDAVAGHSLGELAAAAVAGCLSPERAVDLAVRRGALMGEAARQHPGGMLALATKDAEEVEQALSLGRGAGHISLAAKNTPAQWVLSGDRAALAAVASQYPATRVPVSGAWHSRLMQSAAQSWREDLRAVSWDAPRLAWFCNRDGKKVLPQDDLPDLLADQLTQPIDWSASMRSLVDAGVSRFVLVGPCRALRGLCRANLDKNTTLSVAMGRRALELELCS